MARRGRVRGVCRWACTLLLAALAAALVGGRWWMVRCTWTSHHRVWATLTIGGGVVRACRVPMGLWAPTGFRVDHAPPWEWGWSGKDDRSLPGAWHYGFLYWKDPSLPRLFGLALLYPTVLVAPPTAVLWRIDVRARRRERKGLCWDCGYDRRGLAAGATCPECGKA